MKTIKVTKKITWGKELMYPNCETSRIFADLVGRKTLTDLDIQYIKQLGYTITAGQVETL